MGLPNLQLVSYVNINEFTSRYTDDPSTFLYTVRVLLDDFEREPAGSGGFYHDPARWHTFAATRFFLATASSPWEYSYLAPVSRLTGFLLDKREISECSYLFDWIPRHIKKAKPGDENLLIEIQGIESLQKPRFDELVTNFLVYMVVN